MNLDTTRPLPPAAAATVATASPLALPPMAIVASSVVTSAGVGRDALARAMRDHRSALRPNVISSRPLPTMVGDVVGVDDAHVPPALRRLDCRNHRLATMALRADGFEAAVARVTQRLGAARIGVIMGTSTASIGASEAAYRQRDDQGRVPEAARVPELHSLHSLGLFVQLALGLSGPAITLSTACSSSAKGLAMAQRWLALHVVDAVVVGGADSLCDSVLFGFHALQLVSPDVCRPFDATRRGINLGEGAGFALLMREGDAPEGCARLLGVGESSDAHHLSAPQPDGVSIEAAVRQALQRAQLAPADIQCINLHGTATLQNDAVEAAMVMRVFAPGVHASSTKGFTGHTLGASGIIEAVIGLLSIEQGFMPGTVNSTQIDPAWGGHIQAQPVHAPVRHVVSHAFGFGGSNAALVLGTAR